MSSSFMKPTCAIIGAGFIGSSIISKLSNDGYFVKVLTRSFSSSHSFYSNAVFHYGDFTDSFLLDKVLKDSQIAIHLISSTVPCDVHVDFPNDLRQNLFSTISFLEQCSKHHVSHVLFASSASVYGDSRCRSSFDESSLTNPISSHGMQKLAIEKYLLYYGKLHSLRIHILRISNPFGENQNIYGRQGFIAMVIGNIKNSNPVSLRSDGSIIRDFIHVDNVAFAFQFCIEHPSLNSIVNVSSGHGRSLTEVINCISSLASVSIPIVQYPELPTDIMCSILAPTVLHEHIPVWPVISFSDGLISTLRHFSLLSSTSS